MEPVLHKDTFCFCTTSSSILPQDLQYRMKFEEGEGTTLIVTTTVAEQAGLKAEFPCRMITLNVHSSLGAVGFLARITTHLAKYKMGVNPVSGFYHDHLFVPEDRAADAMKALDELIKECRTK